MISFWRGPGGAWRRALAELVPFGGGCVAVGLYMPLAWTLPPWFAVLAAVLTGAIAWLGVSLVLRAVRRRKTLCRVYRVAVLLHVLFWTALGIAATDNTPAAALQPAGASGWREPVAFLAGAASADFALPAHTTLAGWGQKPRRLTMPPFAGVGALGRLGQDVMACRLDDGSATAPLFCAPDPGVPSEVLGARALVLRPEDPSDGPPVALVRVDLVTSDRKLNAAIADAVADLGFRPEGVLLAATHTHSGPGGYSSVRLSAVIGTDHFDAAVFDAIRAACVEAIRDAHDAATPARLGLVRGHDRDQAGERILGRNRRKNDRNAIDDRVYGLRIEERTGGRAIAAVVNYAVHPVLFRRRHMGFQRDLAGALEREIQAALPGKPLVLFVNGAQGDVNARRVRGATAGERATRLARRFAREAVRPAWTGTRSARRHARVGIATARTRRSMATPRLVMGFGERATLCDALYGPLWEGGAGRLAANALALPVNAFVWSLGLPELRGGFSWDGALGFSANMERGVGTEPYDVGAWLFETHGAEERFALLWQPGEATQAVGKAWRRAVAAHGVDDALLVGLAGGSAAYVTTEAEYRAGGYEAEGTLFGPDTAARFEEALLDALQRAGEVR